MAGHIRKCESLDCPCFNEGYDEGYRHAERERRLAKVDSAETDNRPNGA